MISPRTRLHISSVQSRTVRVGLLTVLAVILIAAGSTARAPALVQELRREADRESSRHSDIQEPGQRSAAQIFVDRYGLAGRKAAEYVAWRYRSSRAPDELRYSLLGVDVLKLLRSDRSRSVLERLSEDTSTTSYVRLSAAAALMQIPGVDGTAVISRVLEKGNSADRRDAFFFVLRHPDPRLLPAIQRALQTESDDHARGLLMLAASMLQNPGKCVLDGPARQGDGRATCFYYCPGDVDTIPIKGQSSCEPLVDSEIATQRMGPAPPK